MVAVAEEGITLLAPAPVRALLMPRMFNDGRLSSSTSFFPPPSVLPSHSSRIRSAIHVRSFSDGVALGIGERLDTVIEVIDYTWPSSSFIDASRCANIMAGFGAQFP